jgi:hypothetical protein
VLLSGYVIMSLVVAVSAFSHAGWTAALSAVVTSLLLLITGARLRQIIFYETDWKNLRGRTFDMATGGIVASLFFIGFAQWLSTKFSVHFFDYTLDGWEWGWMGFAIGFINGRMIGLNATSRR